MPRISSTIAENHVIGDIDVYFTKTVGCVHLHNLGFDNVNICTLERDTIVKK